MRPVSPGPLAPRPAHLHLRAVGLAAHHRGGDVEVDVLLVQVNAVGGATRQEQLVPMWGLVPEQHPAPSHTRGGQPSAEACRETAPCTVTHERGQPSTPGSYCTVHGHCKGKTWREEKSPLGGAIPRLYPTQSTVILKDILFTLNQISKLCTAG